MAGLILYRFAVCNITLIYIIKMLMQKFYCFVIKYKFNLDVTQLQLLHTYGWCTIFMKKGIRKVIMCLNVCICFIVESSTL